MNDLKSALKKAGLIIPKRDSRIDPEYKELREPLYETYMGRSLPMGQRPQYEIFFKAKLALKGLIRKHGYETLKSKLKYAWVSPRDFKEIENLLLNK